MVRDLLGASHQRKVTARQIGPALTKSIMAALEPSDYTCDRVDNLFRLIDTGIAPSALQALPLLAQTQPAVRDRAIKAIRRALLIDKTIRSPER